MLPVPEAATVEAPKAVQEPPKPQRYNYKYLSSARPLTELQLHLLAYRYHGTPKVNADLPPKAWFFKQIALMLWGPKNKIKEFVWNPWAEKMNEVCHEHPVTLKANPHVALSGCASSGKTDFGAIYGLINWLCAPPETLVLFTSVSLSGSKQRIWGRVEEYFQSVNGLPGELVSSKGLIYATDPSGNKISERCALSLVAGERKKQAESMGKIIGAHNKRVFMIADELPELTEALLKTSMSNLSANENFQMVAMGNFKSRYDPFGTFCEPPAGYDTLTLNDYEWESNYGCVVRFSGLKSPNLLECNRGKPKYPGIFSSKDLEEIKKRSGENSAEYWRMVHSFETPIGLDDSIYSEVDLQAGRAYSPVTWLGEPAMVSGLDLGFTNGGDRSAQWIGKWGMTTEGMNALMLHKKILLTEDVLKKDMPRNFQIAHQFVDNCIAMGVAPENAGFDSTGAGSVFGDIVAEVWKDRAGNKVGHKVLRVDFSGSASDLKISLTSEKTGRTAYDRKVTELWYVGLEFMKAKQIRGVTQELARELKARKYDTVKGGDGLKMRVETKMVMKDRLGFSPDIADSFAILLHVCRERLGALAGTATTGVMGLTKEWQKQVQASQSIYEEDAMHQPDQEFEMAV